jgi:hypothetical protein
MGGEKEGRGNGKEGKGRGEGWEGTSIEERGGNGREGTEGREGEKRGGKGAGEGMETPGAGPPKNFGLEPPLDAGTGNRTFINIEKYDYRHQITE